MSTILITRDRQARRWAAEQGLAVDYVFPRLNPRFLRPGDTVIGHLPVPVAARVWAAGGRYLHLSPGRQGRLPASPRFMPYVVCPAFYEGLA